MRSIYKISMSLVLMGFSINLNAYSYEIKNGWQLLGATDNLNIDTFNRECVNYIWRYDKNLESEWGYYKPNSENNTIDNISIGEGFWLNANSECVIEINSTNSIETSETQTSELSKNIPSSIKFKEIPEGSFTMGGETNANDAKEVSITLSSFEISEKEITNSEYIEFLNLAFKDKWISVELQKTNDPCGEYSENMIVGLDASPYPNQIFIQLAESGGCTSNGESEHIDNKSWITFDEVESKFKLLDESKANWPVNWVKWYGADAFAKYYGINLPTEAQWEYSAKGGQNFEYPTDNGLLTQSQANYNGDLPNVHNEDGHSIEVGSYNPNPYGLYDMGGNVWEWCEDYYDANFYTDGAKDPLNGIASSDEKRVRRGGSWNYHSATLLTYARASDFPNRGNNHFGFRVVRNR